MLDIIKISTRLITTLYLQEFDCLKDTVAEIWDLFRSNFWNRSFVALTFYRDEMLFPATLLSNHICSDKFQAVLCQLQPLTWKLRPVASEMLLICPLFTWTLFQISSSYKKYIFLWIRTYRSTVNSFTTPSWLMGQQYLLFLFHFQTVRT